MRDRERWELIYNALIVERPILVNATREEVHDALEELAADAQCGWLTVKKMQAILPRLRDVATQYGCLEHLETIEAAIEDRDQTHATKKTVRASTSAPARSS